MNAAGQNGAPEQKSACHSSDRPASFSSYSGGEEKEKGVILREGGSQPISHNTDHKLIFDNDVAYKYPVLPFGLSLSPRVSAYIDYWLVKAQMEHTAREHTAMLLEHLQKLGLKLNTEKSVLVPKQSITYLGLSLD